MEILKMFSQSFKKKLNQKRLSIFDFFLLLLFIFLGVSIPYKVQTTYRISETKLLMKMETMQMSKFLKDSNIQMRKRMDRKILEVYQEIQSVKLRIEELHKRIEELYNEKKEFSKNSRF